MGITYVGITNPAFFEQPIRPHSAHGGGGLTEHAERGVGGHQAGRVARGAAVHAHVLGLHVGDEEDVVVGHDVHAALAGGGEVGAAVLLPGDLGGGVALGGTLQPRRLARADGAVPRRLQEGRQDCGPKKMSLMYLFWYHYCLDGFHFSVWLAHLLL